MSHITKEKVETICSRIGAELWKYKTFVGNKNILNHFVLLCISSALKNQFLWVLKSLLSFSSDSMKTFESIFDEGLVKTTESFFSHEFDLFF